MYKISLSLSLQKKSVAVLYKESVLGQWFPHAPTLPFPVALAYMWEENLKFITNCMKGIQRHFHILL